ncbi:MAG: family 78 glycoside hydrolase catalytic domain [Phycisphaerae bacterium]|nr:family 78 glycoside hydrolase catalytic domain [Phycisphaerae bacterium]
MSTRAPLLSVLVPLIAALESGLAGAQQRESATMQSSAPPAPSALMCDLLAKPAGSLIRSPRPRFSWVVNSREKDDVQTAYQIVLSARSADLDEDRGTLWDSGRVASSKSTAVEYQGPPLKSRTTYFWKVRTWDRQGHSSAYSAAQEFRTGTLAERHVTPRYRLVTTEVAPARMVRVGADKWFIDFGKAAFATVRLTLTGASDGQTVKVHLGEVPAGKNAINRTPGGSRRYRMVPLRLGQGTHTYTVAIPPDRRNTGPQAIKMPQYAGEVMPFRYCELEGCEGKLDASMVRQIAVHYPFDDDAARFECSSKVLNDIWDLCKYTMKATSFCGVYVDGDRERIPYEADAYINQLGHYCTDREFTLARHTHEYLITHPTWPTEWILYSVLIAWADYMHTGCDASLANYYTDLQAKTLCALAGEDGLISTRTGLVDGKVLASIHFKGKLKDIVDWPHGSLGGVKGQYGETDGYEFTDVNTVVNAFHYRTLVIMSRVAEVLGKAGDARRYADRAERVKQVFNAKLLDKTRGVYVDGVGTSHSSLHANMFPLAFGLVPAQHVGSVVEFIKSRGMVCSVGAAQWILEPLYRAGEGRHAMKLMTAPGDRSWPHMVYDVGTTITLEAWDDKYKPNQDWNHPWGAAPANIIPRRVMGVEPLQPGFAKMRIKPQPGDLEWAKLKLPTIKGPVFVELLQKPGASFKVAVTIPANTTARVYLPRLSDVIELDGKPTKAQAEGDFLFVDGVGSGGHVLEVRK